MEQLSTENPDFHIEEFWIYFKKSMINFYSDYKKNITTRDIDKWSQVLNNLQKAQKYSQIERKIRDYIICYGMDVMRCGAGYHIGILGTNIKRWNKISTQYTLSGDAVEENEHVRKCGKETCIYYETSRKLFQCCLEICIALHKDGINLSDFLQDLELIIIQNNIHPLLELALNIKKICIYDYLIKNVRCLLVDELKNTYGDDIFKNICLNTIRGKTIAKLLW